MEVVGGCDNGPEWPLNTQEEKYKIINIQGTLNGSVELSSNQPHCCQTDLPKSKNRFFKNHLLIVSIEYMPISYYADSAVTSTLIDPYYTLYAYN